jgi:hypothetical protein
MPILLGQSLLFAFSRGAEGNDHSNLTRTYPLWKPQILPLMHKPFSISSNSACLMARFLSLIRGGQLSGFHTTLHTLQMIFGDQPYDPSKFGKKQKEEPQLTPADLARAL